MCNKDFKNCIRIEKETKYLIEKRKQLPEHSRLSLLIDKFLSCHTTEDLIEFLNTQKNIKIDVSDKISFIELKEKIAYELNELILNHQHF